MTPETVRATYRKTIDEVGERVLVRRNTGQGVNHPFFSASVRARVTGYSPNELVGGILQGDRRIIVLVEDLIDAQVPDIKPGDHVLVRNKTLTVIGLDDSTRRIANVLVAYDIQARG